MPTSSGPRTTGKSSCREWTQRVSASASVSDGREGGEVGEHDFAHVHGVDDGLEEDALILDLRGDHDEEAGDDEPGSVEQHAGEHDGEGE